MKNREIILTPQELEELKDEIKFRERVLLRLKQLNGIPDTVLILKTHVNIQWTLIGILIGTIVALFLK